MSGKGEEKVSVLLNVLFALLLAAILIQNLRYLRALRVRTKKSIPEILTMLTGMTAIAVPTCFLAETAQHRILGATGVILIFFACMKPGITEKGILIEARGQELYLWNEIDHAELRRTDAICVTYFRSPGSVVAKQRYRLQDEAIVRDILEKQILVWEVE